MPIKRVALVFDPRPRPETTGSYCLRALQKRLDVTHFLPEQVASADRGEFDLFLRIDDGLRSPWPETVSPSAYWAIDTHLDFEWALTESRRFDFVFAAQRDGARELERQGIKHVRWLPLACDPEIHRSLSLAKIWDVSFVGHVLGSERARLLELIRSRFPKCFVGQRYFEEMASVYSQSKIIFNRSIRNDVNMRVFEALASGSLLITNHLESNGQAELFHDQEHLVTYQDEEDLIQKIMRYLKDDSERERIALEGHKEVLAKHTYDHRMERLLEVVENQLAKWRDLGHIISKEYPKGLAETAESPRGKEEALESLVMRRDKLRRAMPAQSDPPGRLKDSCYFEFDRPEVLALVPSTAQRVLEIGCGAGRLGETLKKRQRAEVLGVELDPEAASRAACRLDQVILGNVESDDLGFSEGKFDAVICADVLEHLRAAELVLKRIQHWLTPDGVLVASLPNVRHQSVVRSLLAGNWTYEPAGLLDETHLRFFTRREIDKLFFRSGFQISEWQAVPGPGYQDWEQKGCPSSWDLDGFRYQGRSARDVEEFFIYQYLVVAKPLACQAVGPTSIILVTHNQLNYTRGCIESVRFLTDEPYELIVVDNGSTDGTVGWLNAQPDIRLIENSENRGFPAAVNQGLEVASGQQILLLNNDTLVTTGWLRRMLDCLDRDPAIGLVGPCSNHVSGEQQIPVDYEQLSDLDGFAWEWSKANRGIMEETDRLVGFCLLIRREVIEHVGQFDERFGIGCFEDDDYCRRAVHAGYKCVIARDAFVHHFGSRTFLGSQADFAGILKRNQHLFEEKWKTLSPDTDRSEENGHEPDGTASSPKRRTKVREKEAIRLVPKPVRLSLCMIVRDNEHTIRPCLESIRPYVDEMIVVDTGSKDKTPEICKELGARVEYFPWCDDFSAARNESLKYASGEWLFWMDSDDTIPPECGQKLRELADGKHDPSLLGYVMQVHCPGADACDVTVVDHVKLFRNRPDLRFEFRIHEQILPAIRRTGGEVAFTDLYVVHSGATKTAAGRSKKLERDFRILHLDLAERPDHPFVLFNLGMTYADASQHEEALSYLRKCIEVSGANESHLRKAYALLVSSLEHLGQTDAALKSCRAALELFPQDKELLFRRALIKHRQGKLQQAVVSYQQILCEEVDRHFSSIDPGISGHKARHNLAIVYEELGQWENSQKQWEWITQTRPDYRVGWKGLVEILLKSDRESEAWDLVRCLQNDPRQFGIGHLLAARLLEREGQFEKALATIKCVLSRLPGDQEAQEALCRMLFEHGRLQEAEDALRRLLELDPDDASAHHNLACVSAQRGDWASAITHYERSLELRPNAPHTLEQLHTLRRRIPKSPVSNL